MTKANQGKYAYILFTRIPVAGHTKTRMMPEFNGNECALLHTAFLKDINRQIQGLDIDLFIYYALPGNPDDLKVIFGNKLQRPVTGFHHGNGEIIYRQQCGSDLGQKMYQAMEDVLSEGYERCVLTGTDLPDLSRTIIEDAFNRLQDKDVVLGPTRDGGYYLIGSKKPQPACFKGQEYGGSNVFENTVIAVEKSGLTVGLAAVLGDMDDHNDVLERIKRMRHDKKLRYTYTGRFLADHLRTSIIIPVFNEVKTIDNIQDDLMKYCKDCEVIFVDGGSTDGTLDHIRRGFKVLHSDKGRAKQMNLGASVAKGEVLFFLHADSRIPKSVTSDIRKVMVKSPVGCFHIGFTHKRFLMWTNSILSDKRVKREGIMFGDQGIFIDRRFFDSLGGFPDIPIMEDYQLSLNIRKRNVMPVMAKSKIITSDRRYPGSAKGTLRLMKQMYDMRVLYRKGVDVNRLSKYYKDIRE